MLPAAVDMCREMIGEAAATKLLTVPLSNDTVSCQISEMASDIQNQVLERMKGSPFFSIQLDESTDISKAALLLFFVRYRWSGILQEDMLCCGELPTRTTAQECLVLFMLIIDCSNRFKSLFELFESLFGPI